MRKLFGFKPHKQDGHGQESSHDISQHGQDPPIYQQFASQQPQQRHSRTVRRSDSADRWSMVNKPSSPTPNSNPHDDPLPNPHPHNARTSSLANTAAPPSPVPQRRTAALGILRALDPAQDPSPPPSSQDHHTQQQQPQQQTQQQVLQKKRQPFWNPSKDPAPTKEAKDSNAKDIKPARLLRDNASTNTLNATPEAELTRMIGYLTATSSEDWTLVMEVCERASSSEASAKEAVKALRREFKYGEPPAQLAAARLWAMMLRNSSDILIAQSTSKKFLDCIEDLLSSSRTSPVVKERVLDVIAAAAYASGSHTAKDGFKGLWKRVKPADKPDEGIPFDTNDSMFTPVLVPPPPPATHEPEKRRRSRNRNRIIPLEEDMIRLHQECKLASGNAALLLENIKFARPQDLRGDVIQEFHQKCLNSHELIFAQVDWATAQADKSRIEADAVAAAGGETVPPGETDAEKLLSAILTANSALQEALNMYDDLKRVGIEQQAEEQSKKEWRMDRRTIAQLEQANNLTNHTNGGGASGAAPQLVSVPPPPPIPSFHKYHHPNHSYDGDRDHLAPPPMPPLGPRSPASNNHRTSTPRSRSPSPSRTPSPHHSHNHSYSQSKNMVYDTIPPPSHSTTSLPPSHQQQPYQQPHSPPQQYQQPHPTARALPLGLVAGHGGGSATSWNSQSRGVYPSSNYSYTASNYTNRGGLDSDESPTDEDVPPPMPSAKALGKRRAQDDTLDLPSRNHSPNSSLNSQSYSPPSSDPYDTTNQHPSHLQSDNASISSDSSDINKPQIRYVYDAAAERTQARIRELRAAERAKEREREKERLREREKEKEKEKQREREREREPKEGEKDKDKERFKEKERSTGALNATRKSTLRTR